MNYQYRGDNKELGRENKEKGEIITKREIKRKFKKKYWQKKTEDRLQKEYKETRMTTFISSEAL